MSNEQGRDDETEVEGHATSAGANDEPASEDVDDEVEAHVYKTANVRMDSPSNA